MYPISESLFCTIWMKLALTSTVWPRAVRFPETLGAHPYSATRKRQASGSFEEDLEAAVVFPSSAATAGGGHSNTARTAANDSPRSTQTKHAFSGLMPRIRSPHAARLCRQHYARECDRS